MEKLRRVLSGQDDEEQGLTAQVGSPRRPGAAGRGAGPVCRTCSRRGRELPGVGGPRRLAGARPAPWASLAPRSALAALPSRAGRLAAARARPRRRAPWRTRAAEGAVCFGRREPGAQAAGHGEVSSTESDAVVQALSPDERLKRPCVLCHGTFWHIVWAPDQSRGFRDCQSSTCSQGTLTSLRIAMVTQGPISRHLKNASAAVARPRLTY